MKTDFELTKKIVEIETKLTHQAGPEGVNEAMKEILELVLQSVTDNLEFTNATMPYMLLTLENICSGIRSVMDHIDTLRYELMRNMYGKYIVSMVVPASMIKDGGDGGKGERDEEKRE